MPAISPKKRINQRGDATRDRILDAAEQLFAECGFDGTSMRDISSAAQAELGSIGYHFRSKDDIYTKVLQRRNEQSCQKLASRLEQIQQQKKMLTINDVFSAFTGVVFDTFRSGDNGLMYWARLLMQRQPVENNGRLHSAVAKHYLPVRQRYLAALSAVIPNLPAAKLDWCFSLFELSFGSALFSSTQKSFALQRISASELQDLQDSHIEFFSAGLRQIEAGLNAATPAKSAGQTQGQNQRIGNTPDRRNEPPHLRPSTA